MFFPPKINFFLAGRIYSYTEKLKKKGQRKQYKIKQNKGKLCTANID